MIFTSTWSLMAGRCVASSDRGVTSAFWLLTVTIYMEGDDEKAR